MDVEPSALEVLIEALDAGGTIDVRDPVRRRILLPVLRGMREEGLLTGGLDELYVALLEDEVDEWS